MPGVWFPKHLLNWASSLIFPDLRHHRLGQAEQASCMFQTWNPENAFYLGMLQ